MTSNLSRRQFTTGAAATAAALALPVRAFAAGSNFKIGVISDEISGDFDHACYVIAKEFGLQFVELRELWDGRERTEPGELTDRYARVCESDVLARPADWLWTYRRWRHPKPLYGSV